MNQQNIHNYIQKYIEEEEEDILYLRPPLFTKSPIQVHTGYLHGGVSRKMFCSFPGKKERKFQDLRRSL